MKPSRYPLPPLSGLSVCACVQYVVVPTRRATAIALQIMVCHLLGDAASPYIIGVVRETSEHVALLNTRFLLVNHGFQWSLKNSRPLL